MADADVALELARKGRAASGRLMASGAAAGGSAGSTGALPAQAQQAAHGIDQRVQLDGLQQELVMRDKPALPWNSCASAETMTMRMSAPNLAQAPRDFPALHAGHGDVEQHQFGAIDIGQRRPEVPSSAEWITKPSGPSSPRSSELVGSSSISRIAARRPFVTGDGFGCAAHLAWALTGPSISGR
jgi:hypothetical protein